MLSSYWFTEGVTASLPKNLSGREYNGMNSMMLMLHAEKEGFKMPVWATFDRITGLNYVKDKQGVKHEAKDSEGNNLPLVSVNKGAKSFPVFITTFTVVDKETKEKIKYDDYRQMTEQDRERYNVYPKLSVYNVFNVEGQTNLKEARPELFKKLQEQNEVNRPVQQEGEMFSFPAIDHMIAENKWICPIKPTYGDSAYYSISKNEIVIPEKKQFKNGESFYSNLALKGIRTRRIGCRNVCRTCLATLRNEQDLEGRQSALSERMAQFTQRRTGLHQDRSSGCEEGLWHD